MVELDGHMANPRPFDHTFIETDKGIAGNDIGIHAASITEIDGGRIELFPIQEVKEYDYKFQWFADKPGTHYIRAGYVTVIGMKRVVEHKIVEVMEIPPLTFDPPLQSLVDDTKVTINISQNSAFHPNKIELEYDKVKLTPVSTDPYQFIVPAGKSKTGTYGLRLQAYDSASNRYESQLQIKTPDRLKITVPENFEINSDTDRLQITPVIESGYKPDKLEYYLVTPKNESKLIATAAGDNPTAALNLNDYTTGNYSLYIISIKGEYTLRTTDQHIYINNPAGDARYIQKQKDEAERKIAETEANTEALLKDNLNKNPKLTYSQLITKATQAINDYCKTLPANAGGKKPVLKSIRRTEQPDPAKNIYLVSAIIDYRSNTRNMIFEVNTDTGEAKDTGKTW